MAHALGYRFFDAAGVELEPVPANLGLIERVEVPDRSGWPRVTAACDVTNPLLGLQGATRVYGPQKGVRLERMEAFEAGEIGGCGGGEAGVGGTGAAGFWSGGRVGVWADGVLRGGGAAWV
jgi:glycerate 2-kinase